MLFRSRRIPVRHGPMRDTDQDLVSVIVVRADSDLKQPSDLVGKRVGVGAWDSPQATLLPLAHLRRGGVRPGVDFEVVPHDVLGGKHGDHIGGERDAARALMAGKVDAACMIDGNHLAFLQDGSLSRDQVRILARTDRYDHCIFTHTDRSDEAAVSRFYEALLGMTYEDPAVRPLLDLEGLKVWRPGRLQGFAPLEAAVDSEGFLDAAGALTCAAYRS